MLQVDQDLESLFDDVVRPQALNIHYETDAAGIMFVLWMVEALLNRESDHD